MRNTEVKQERDKRQMGMKKGSMHVLVVFVVCCGFLSIAHVMGAAEAGGQNGENIGAALLVFGGKVLFWTMAAGYGVAGLAGIFYRRWALGLSFVACAVLLGVAPMLFNPVRLSAQPEEGAHETHE